MRNDLDLLLRAYEAVHPGLRRFLPAGGFADRVAKARIWAGREQSLSDFFVALTRLTASVRCGHTHPNPFNQGREARAALFAGRNRLPLTFRWIAGRMIVTGRRAPSVSVVAGSEMLSLDGVPARHLLAAMLPLTRADGSNDSKRLAQLGLAERDRYAPFDIYRPMLFPVRSDGVVRTKVRDPDGREREVELPALTEEEIQASHGRDGPEFEWTFAIRPDRVGLLTMPDWVTYRSKWDWKNFLDSAVDRLIDERASSLVIDLRGNEGGTECGRHLLERLVDREVPLPAFISKVRYRTLPAELAVPLDTWDPSFRNWGTAAIGPDAEGFYRLDRADQDPQVLRPRGRRFGGSVAVLVDSTCSSATFQFANAIHDSRLAMLVGEPTGGNRRGINGGAYFFVRLPESGLEVDLPIIGSFPSRPQPDSGVRPDRIIALTARDIALGRDRQLEAAIAALGGNRSVRNVR